MQAKRSHLASFGDSDTDNGGAFKKSATLPAELESEQTPCPVGILAVSSPKVAEESVHNHVSVHGKLASFLEKCHFCRKRMLEDGDAFMDGCLRAFCSTGCREKQNVCEKFVERIVLLQKERASSASEPAGSQQP